MSPRCRPSTLAPLAVFLGLGSAGAPVFALGAGAALSAFGATACSKSMAGAEAEATTEATFLADSTVADVALVKQGLPLGAAQLAPLFANSPDVIDASVAETALKAARGKVQDLRLAKSTFFALATVGGEVLRSDQEPDRLAGKSLFEAFPALAKAPDGYVETTGVFAPAARHAKADGQWAAAVPITVGGVTRALYVTGWSWAHYAFVLQNKLRGRLKAAAADAGGQARLAYVFIVTPTGTYAWRETPAVDTEAVAQAAAEPSQSSSARLITISGREFVLAVKPAPALGPGISVAVLLG